VEFERNVTRRFDRIRIVWLTRMRTNVIKQVCLVLKVYGISVFGMAINTHMARCN